MFKFFAGFSVVLFAWFAPFSGVRFNPLGSGLLSPEIAALAPLAQTPGKADHYDLTGPVLSIPEPGVLANDYTAGLNVKVRLERDATSGSILLNDSGGFTYTPTAGFSGEDSFSYRLVYGRYRSEPVEVTLTVAQDNAPVIAWVQPVAAGQRYDLAPNASVLLRVDVTDESPAATVTFRRWDAPHNRYLEIGVISASPYQLEVPASLFNDGWNQVNADAQDPAGHLSDSPFIWIYRTPSTPEPDFTSFRVLLPSIQR